MSLDSLLSFALIASLLVMSPGPNGALIAKTVPTSGVMAGFANIAGFVTAFYIHGTLSILGISAILLRSAELFMVVKLAGAAYLIWIGIKALRDAARRPSAILSVAPARRRRSLAAAYGEGLLTNALNPKVSMFYLAAFPQFIPHSLDAVPMAFGLVTLHALINLVWFSAIVLLLTKVVAVAKRDGIQRMIKAVTGVVFVGFGVRLAMTRA
ncbi:MAG: LysE family translocator [Fulvimarina manganoxydans]|uniref:LysE family translocator n=1 Tax=Fulvimarina manganoxydans TaxID=937218 RepID=UPI002357BEFB|nr:LysE family translocator [Fulvimarina manganoxydans]MCK5930702.1 LysE family translocator [Fulvimarina manganoxydans]